MYEVIQVNGGMLGGHYAVIGKDGEIIGKEFGLDKRQANILSNDLRRAYRRGQEEKINIIR
jgi:hypothetical protein